MIYFDNSATTKPYKEVLDSFVTVASDYFGNPSSLHQIGGKSEQLLTQARTQIAALLGVKPKEVLFTSGATEGNNMAIKGTALMHRGRGKHIISTQVEHPSVTGALEQLEELGFSVTYVPVDSEGRVNVKDIEREIRSDTILVSVIHVNNEVGTIQPIKEIGKMLKGYPKILYHVDHVQGVGKVPFNIYEAEIDFCTISAHKFHGLKGTGALFMKEGVRISPIFSGGNQEWKTRSGTENVPGIVAMAKALRMTLEKQKNNLNQMTTILEKLKAELSVIEDVQIHTPSKGAAPHILNFSLSNIKAEVFVHSLGQQGIFVSTTSACSSKQKSASKTLLAMGVPKNRAESAIRISLSYENTAEEAEKVAQATRQAIIQLREVM